MSKVENKEYKFSGYGSRDDKLVKIKNSLVPECYRFRCFGAAIEQNRGFRSDTANKISVGRAE